MKISMKVSKKKIFGKIILLKYGDNNAFHSTLKSFGNKFSNCRAYRETKYVYPELTHTFDNINLHLNVQKTSGKQDVKLA